MRKRMNAVIHKSLVISNKQSCMMYWDIEEHNFFWKNVFIYQYAYTT